ncbi:MAG: palindromic element RPE1 domain-containing protein [Candidatus Tisiphia sp.]
MYRHFRSQNRSILNVRENSSTGSTHKLPAEVEFQKISNK